MIDSDELAMGMDFVWAMDLAAIAVDATANAPNDLVDALADDGKSVDIVDGRWYAALHTWSLLIVQYHDESIDLRLACIGRRMLFLLSALVALIYARMDTPMAWESIIFKHRYIIIIIMEDNDRNRINQIYWIIK